MKRAAHQGMVLQVTELQPMLDYELPGLQSNNTASIPHELALHVAKFPRTCPTHLERGGDTDDAQFLGPDPFRCGREKRFGHTGRTTCIAS